MEDESARMTIKQGNGLPTIPASSDHRNGDWIATDIYEAEQYLDNDTGLIYTRNGTNIVLVSGGGDVGSLEFNDTDKTVWNNGKGDNSGSTSFGEGVLKSAVNVSDVTGYGYFSLYSAITVDSTCVFGSNAFLSATILSSSVAIGSDSGRFSNSYDNLTSVNGSIFIGPYSRSLNTTSSNEIVIGYDASGNGDNTVTLGNNNVVKTFLKGIINSSKTFTVASLPSGVLGDSTIVTDATAPTYLGALTGGGSVKCPVWHNGTNWVSR